MVWTSSMKSALFLCTVALGNFNSNIVGVYGQELHQEQNDNKDTGRNLIVGGTFFGIPGVETEPDSEEPTETLFEPRGGAKAKVPKMPTPYPTAHPTPAPYKPYYPPPPPKPHPLVPPTPEPTPSPTKNPTPDPTPTPTLRPTPVPTKIPTPEPSPQPTTGTPTPYPTESPSAAPTTPPTKSPTGAPSVEPTAFPSATPTTAEPSSEPSFYPSDDPSEEPTTSEEPSDSPSVSEEPSDAPSGSEVPSAFPSTSGQPTAAPTTPSDAPSLSPTASSYPSGGPTESNVLSLTGIICNAPNAYLFSTLCKILSQFPNLFNNLNATNRRLLEDHRDLQQPDTYTVFAPTNAAFDRVVLPFGLEIDFEKENFTADEKPIVRFILKYHISANTRFFDHLECDEKLQTKNGEQSQTRCSTNGKEEEIKFQVGQTSPLFGDDDDKQVIGLLEPKIVSADVPASNGVLHVINNVIVPDLTDLIPDPGPA